MNRPRDGTSAGRYDSQSTANRGANSRPAPNRTANPRPAPPRKSKMYTTDNGRPAGHTTYNTQRTRRSNSGTLNTGNSQFYDGQNPPPDGAGRTSNVASKLKDSGQHQTRSGVDNDRHAVNEHGGRVSSLDGLGVEGRSYHSEPARPPPSWDDPYDKMSPEEQNQLLKEFMALTGSMDLQLATDILAAKDWDVTKAVEVSKQLRTDDPPKKTISDPQQSDVTTSHSPEGANQSDSNTGIDRDRRLLRGLSKVYDLKDGAESIEIDKKHLLNSKANPRAKQLNMNIGLDNSYMLPDLSGLNPELAEYIEYELIDFVTMNVLERTGNINWWAKHFLSRRLWPLHTTGDGNCLLHAASLGMWGVQDKHLLLRQNLHHFLNMQTESSALYRRWRWQQTQSNMEMGLIFNEDEWRKEWKGLLSLSSTTTKLYEDGDRVLESLEFLEEFHVYVLAQIIERPIIVFADSVLRDVEGYPLSPLPFGGIYLPLERKAEDCYKSPLLLAYDRSHFTAVVTMEPSKSTKEHNPMKDLVPLTGPDCDLLQMHFFVDPGPSVNWDNLPEDRCTMMSVINSVSDYLDVKNIPREQLESGSVVVDDSPSNSSSSSSLNGKEGKSSMAKVRTKALTILGRSNSKLQNKVKDVKNVAADLELEPGNELIMCAKLSVSTPKAYQKDMEKYLHITKQEFEERKHQGRLRDPRTIPPIATKDYAKKLSLAMDEGGRQGHSPTALSPGGKPCLKCSLYLGTPEQDNLCSACYRETDVSHLQTEPCRNCKKFTGTKDKHYYCSRCYDELLEGKPLSDNQTNNSNMAGVKENKLATEYAVQLPSGDDGSDYDDLHPPRVSYDQQHYAFPTNHNTYVIAGNPSLRTPYDQSTPAGLLQRSPRLIHKSDPRPREGFSLGLDSYPTPMPTSGLHMTRSNVPTMVVYKDQQRGTSIPITHHGLDHRPTTTSSSKQKRACRVCRKDISPIDDSGICRFCRSNTKPNTIVAPRLTFDRSAHLEQCKRVSCHGKAVSNVGLCRRCIELERTKRPKQSTNSRFAPHY